MAKILPALNRSAVLVTPRQPFVDWLRSVDTSSADLEVEDVCAPTIYLLAGAEDDEVLERLVCEASRRIFEDQLEGWYRVRSRWPITRDFETFCLWFDYRAEALLLDLCEDPLAHD